MIENYCFVESNSLGNSQKGITDLLNQFSHFSGDK